MRTQQRCDWAVTLMSQYAAHQYLDQCYMHFCENVHLCICDQHPSPWNASASLQQSSNCARCRECQDITGGWCFARLDARLPIRTPRPARYWIPVGFLKHFRVLCCWFPEFDIKFNVYSLVHSNIANALVYVVIKMCVTQVPVLTAWCHVAITGLVSAVGSGTWEIWFGT